MPAPFITVTAAILYSARSGTIEGPLIVAIIGWKARRRMKRKQSHRPPRKP